MIKSKPNIVYILADDLGYGDLRCNNPDSKIPTPNLDRLAEQGMRFTDTHASASVCTPSRYSILTGRYCWRTPLKRSVLWPWDPPLIEPNQPTVPGLLRRHGYRTACVGKWHLGWKWATLDGRPAHEGTEIGEPYWELREALERNIDYRKPLRGGPVDCGFDYYFGVDVPNFPPYTWFEQDRLVDPPTEEKPGTMYGLPGRMKPGWKLEEMIPELTRRAVNYIESSGPAPFFLYFALTSPHSPIVPNRQFIGRSGAGLYGDFVCEIDWIVGEIIAALERKGISNNTLLIFTSDNGPEREIGDQSDPGAYERIRLYGHASMARLRGIKRDLWEGGHRVPFIARWPGVTPAGSVCDRLTLLNDLIATCAELLGGESCNADSPFFARKPCGFPQGGMASSASQGSAKMPRGLPRGASPDSVSVLPLLRGEIDDVPRDGAVHHSGSGKFAVRQDRWVFIDAPSGDDNREPDWFKQERGYIAHDYPGELFNLGNDLAEGTNLYANYPEVVQKLSAMLGPVRSEDVPSDRPTADGTSESE